MELGEKLRQARIQAGLSQRELCGDTITRNMLSQIEHGNATPSVGTLRELAGRLGKPVGWFFGEEAPEDGTMEIWRALQRHDLAGAVKGEPQPGLRGLLRLIGLLALAEENLDREIYARELLDRALAQEETLGLPGLRHQRLWLLGELTGEGESLDRQLYLRAARAFEQQDCQRAARLLDAAEDHLDPRWNLLRGKIWLARGETVKASNCFHGAEARFPEETAPLLEQCYRELEDYKMAYFYACKQK